MLRDYNELIEEIKEITTVDGFVSSCLEIKESMFFYERELMLAAYTASLELLTVAAMLTAALKGKRELHKAHVEVERSLDALATELDKYQFPLDIQYVVDHFVQGTGFRTLLRLPAYTQMMQSYCSGIESSEEDLDTIIHRAHILLQQGSGDLDEDLNRMLGRAGVKMLRGANLRSVWLRVSHPRIQVVLQGLQTLMSNLRVTPYYNYPLEDIATERQKRKKVKGNVVSDLSVFRNFRQGGSGYTDLNTVFEKDRYDHFFESLFSSFEYIDVQPDQGVIDLLLKILDLRLVNEDFHQSFLMRLFVYCNRWAITEVSDTVLKILAELDSDDPLYYECWSLLKSFDGKALPAMRRFARTNRDSTLLPYLAVFLSHGPPTKRRWSLLTEIFEHYPEESEERAQIAISIGRYGGEEAVTYLEKALNSAQHANGPYGDRLKKALESAKEKV
ncbi:MAG: hypothetical protein M0R49_00730 [Limnochordia bacterium]|nr:hypothetical protein [Limnochordia bacterium]